MGVFGWVLRMPLGRMQTSSGSTWLWEGLCLFNVGSTKAGRGAGQKPEVVLTGEGDKEEVELTWAARSVYKAETQETRWRGTGPETRD